MADKWYRLQLTDGLKSYLSHLRIWLCVYHVEVEMFYEGGWI